VLYEITDMGAAGEEIEILDQDVVHLGSEPFRARRVVVNLGKSRFVYHSISHHLRSMTKVPPALMAMLVVGPESRASFDGRRVDSDVLVTAAPGAEVEIVAEEGYESIDPDDLIR
jgi:hypothetical protein